VGDFFNGAYQDMDRSQLRHNHDYLALLRDQPLWFPPGTHERYSNGGYVLLGEVIAKASGEDYYDYLARHLYAPAGMKATGAPIEGDGTSGLARGYTRQGVGTGDEQDNAVTRPARASAAGGSYSTAADLVAFEKALLAGRLCAKPWADWVTGGPRPDRSRAAPDPPVGYGFAGGAPGIAGEWMHEGDLTLVVLTNRDPETTKQVMAPLRQLFRRMKTAPRRGNP
jgi:CubicO group peptidase (beta-lactamase class C family)